MNTKKGQYFSFDAIIASIIFILTFVALLSYWFSVKSSLDSKDDQMGKEAARITDAMFTPAYLLSSYGDRRVNLVVLSNSLPADEAALKKKFNSPYNMYVVVTSWSAPAGSPILARGAPPPAGAQNVARVRRVFVYSSGSSESEATLDLYLYDSG